MTAPRQNDAKAKRLRARLRSHGDPCHVCGGEIAYTAYFTDPLAFQLDHLWPLALGGPAYDWDNVASAHRACNMARSNKVDAIAIEAAAQYGATLTRATPNHNKCAPDGLHCTQCQGIHNPQPGVTFMTSRNWWSTPGRVTTQSHGRPPLRHRDVSPRHFFPNPRGDMPPTAHRTNGGRDY